MTVARLRDKKRILVFSASFGGPHAEVAESLVAYLKRSHAPRVEASTVDFLEQFAPHLNVLAKFGYQQTAEFFPAAKGDFRDVQAHDPDNPVVSELVSGAQARAAEFLDEFRPDAVISVLPVAAAVASEASRGRFASVAVLCGYAAHGTWFHPATKRYFVSTPEMRDELIVGGIEWDRVTVSGLPVTSTLEVSLSCAAQRRQLGLADRFTCVIDAPSGAAGEIVEIASNIAAAGVQVGVAYGRATRLAHQLGVLSKRSGLSHAFGRDTPVAAVVSVADVVVTSPGGPSPLIALSLGIPLILYNPVPEQERYNVDFLVNSGAALLARDAEDVAQKLVYLSTHPKRLHQMAQDAFALSRRGAAETICERVLTMVG